MQSTEPHGHKSSTAALTLGALGVVFGDIGTSPLYAFKECFHSSHGVAIVPDNVLGILSLIFWSLIIVVSVKYVAFIMRADNNGEGGIMALLALTLRTAQGNTVSRRLLLATGIFGASLFYGDGIITPAISVLSAVEGLEIAAPGLEPYIIPITIAVLISLFLIQHRGTASVGKLFGPVMLVWFAALALLGVHNVLRYPAVLAAINPAHAMHFMLVFKWQAFVVLGAVVLTVTGAEALYADMGHFGRHPIRLAWIFLVFPALLLNYAGQAALVLNDATAIENPFYLLAPEWALLPMVGLATLATIIASQAVISGAFSLTRQAIQLGYVPRMFIQHTSSEEQGQIYIGMVNWALMVGVVLLVVGFESSGALAAAYGVAVTGTMLITTLLASAVVLLLWKAPRWLAVQMLLAFLLVDSLYFAANAPKILQGGAFPVIAGLALFTLMTTWKRGRRMIVERLDESSLPLDLFITSLRAQPPHRVGGTAVFLSARPEAVPHALLHNLLHNQVLHEQVVLLTVVFEDEPRVNAGKRFEVEEFGDCFFRVSLHFGFMEEPDVPLALSRCQRADLEFGPMRTTYFLSRETVIAGRQMGMARWREHLFAFLLKNANSNLKYFKLPLNRVIELGTQVEI